MSLNEYFKNPLVNAAYSFLSLMRGDEHLAILKVLHQSQYFSPEKLCELQLKKLRVLLGRAGQHSPFWKNRFVKIGMQAGDIKNLSALSHIPVLTKKDIIENRDMIFTQDIVEAELIENNSGGTTGSPLSYYLDCHRAAVREAATLRHDLWAGCKIGDRRAVIWGGANELDAGRTTKARLRERFWGKQIYLDSIVLADNSIRIFIDKWRKFRPETVLSYAGALDFFVKYLEDHSIELPGVRTIITSAEVLFPEARVRIEKYFGAKVFERYGCREISVIASECDQHNGLHINSENLYLEFETVERLPDGTRLAQLLITDLENQVFPFIRYRLGDLVIVDDHAGVCACGRTLPTLRAVAGRISDYIKLPDGRFMSGTGLTISLLAKAQGVLKTQIVQKSADKLLLRIVKNDKFDENSIGILRAEFGKLVGDKMTIEFEFPEKIEREKSGKYRLAISEITE